MRIEQDIKKNGKEQLYNYYLNLGYEHKVAASLSLFTYGEYRYKSFSMDDLYDALCKGEEYIPPEVLEMRRQQEAFRNNLKRTACSPSPVPNGIPHGIINTVQADSRKATSTGVIEKFLRIPEFLSAGRDECEYCDFDE